MDANTWNTILGAVGAIAGLYGAGKGSGSTPNVYPLPLTPSEKTANDAKGSLFNYASGYVDQYLRGLGDLNPSWSPTSTLLGPTGGGGFMGGVKVPTIDWSKMPSAPHVTIPGSADTKPGLPGAGTNAGDPDQNIPGPANPGQDPFANWPQKPDATNYNFSDIKNAFGSSGVQIATSILGANPGATLVTVWGILNNIFGTQHLPPSNLDWSKIDLTPGNTPPGSTPPPPTGTNLGDIPTNIPRHDVPVGGNLGDPGKPPPGWSLDNPYGWLNGLYGGGGSADPWSGTPNQGGGRKPHF